MAIQQFKISFPGQQVNPRIGHLLTSDNLAAVTVAGYLNPYMLSQGFSVLPTDAILVRASDGINWYSPSFGVNGIVTLVVFS